MNFPFFRFLLFSFNSNFLECTGNSCWAFICCGHFSFFCDFLSWIKEEKIHAKSEQEYLYMYGRYIRFICVYDLYASLLMCSSAKSSQLLHGIFRKGNLIFSSNTYKVTWGIMFYWKHTAQNSVRFRMDRKVILLFLRLISVFFSLLVG